MQTNFTPQQLAEPGLREADEILRRCTHCGLCTATCPTYVLRGDERDSPRGRIYLIKNMLEAGAGADATISRHIDRCLSCLSCVTTCPQGVDYKHLVDHARSHIERTGRRSSKDRALRQFIVRNLTDPERLRKLLRAGRFVKPIRGALDRLGLKDMAALLALMPAGLLPSAAYGGPGLAATKHERRKRVIVLAGCSQQVLRPEINDATIRLLARRGVDVEIAASAVCCGAVAQQLGKDADVLASARRNVDAWTKLIDKAPVDAVIINSGDCGVTVKDYGYLLRNDPAYAERAKAISSLAQDVAAFLEGHDLGPPKRWSSLRIAYHSSCALQHGQGIDAGPRALLSKAGFAVVEVGEGHLCCGAAASYNLLQPELSAQLRQRKVENIERAKSDLVAAGSVGCIMQLSLGLEKPVVHTVELLDWAYGGPVPRGLQKFVHLMNDVPDPQPVEISGLPKAAAPIEQAGSAAGKAAPDAAASAKKRVEKTPA